MLKRKPHHKRIGPASYEAARDKLIARRKGKKPSRFGLSQRPLTRKGKPQARLKAGRKTKAWEATRRKLKVKYAAMGVTFCELRYEGCKRDDWLSFAHGRKRRHLAGNELETLTILACTPCHDQIEALTESEMCAIVLNVIAARKKAA